MVRTVVLKRAQYTYTCLFRPDCIAMHRLLCLSLRLLLAVACFLTVFSARAQVGTDVAGHDLSPAPPQQDYRIDAFDERDGLSHTAITSITQDSTGFLWFATHSGLNRFDGFTFTHFYHDPDDSNTPLHDAIESLYVDREGALWIGYHHGGGGLSRFDLETETFTHYRHDPGDPTSLGQDTVLVMLEDSRGALWIGTVAGLVRFDRETETFTHFRHDPSDPTTLSNNHVRVLYEDSRGTLWVGTGSPEIAETPEGEGGLNRFDPETGTFTRYLHDPSDPASLGNNKVQALLEDSRGVFWVGTVGDGLYVMDRERGTFARPFSVPVPEPCPLWFCGVSFVHEDRSGAIWIGVFAGGLLRHDPATGSTLHFEANQNRANSLLSNLVFRIHEARDGSIWVGTLGPGGGLHRIVPEEAAFPLIWPAQDTPTDWSIAYVSGLHVSEDGRLWVATGGGLARFDPATGQFVLVRHGPEDPTTLSDNQLTAVYEDREGNLWMGLWGGGIARREQGFTRYHHDPADPKSLGHSEARMFLEDSHGALWIGTAGGLDRFDRETETFTHFRHDPSDPSSLSGDIVTALHEDRAGTLWVGAQGGLNRVVRSGERETISFERFLSHLGQGDFVTALHEDAQGRFWVGTFWDGLYLFDRRRGSYERFSTDDGLAEGRIDAILEDEAGFLWISSSRKTLPRVWNSGQGRLSRFDPGTRTAVVFGPPEGLPVIGYMLGVAGRGPDGTLYFGGTGGVTAFDPVTPVQNRPPKTVVTGVRIFNSLVRPGPEAPIDRPPPHASAIVLEPDENDFTVEYAGLDYREPERTQYQYRLDPHDAGWVNAGTQRSARYAGLAPGDYTFRVRAANRYGIWSEEPTTIEVRVLPPWWRTTWAYALYGLLFVAGVLAVYRVQRRRLVQRERQRAVEREAELERENARRLRAANEALEDSLDRLTRTQDQLIQSEKLASLGALAAGIAHEIKNPLNFVNNFAALSRELAEETDPEEARSLLADLRANAEKIEAHGRRADAIVQSMMQHASGGSGQREPTDLNALVAEYVDLAYHGKRAQVEDFNADVVRDFGTDVGRVVVVSQEIGRVALNLLSNAFDAVQDRADATVTVSTQRVDGSVEIRVSDNGPGIPSEIREKIFEPFFTTKPTGSGPGLGLSLAYDIVTQGHGGTLTVEHGDGAGATVVVALPAEG